MLRDSQEYMDINRRIMTECRNAKESWLNAKCDEIEKLRGTDTRTMYREINEISEGRVLVVLVAASKHKVEKY